MFVRCRPRARAASAYTFSVAASALTVALQPQRQLQLNEARSHETASHTRKPAPARTYRWTIGVCACRLPRLHRVSSRRRCGGRRRSVVAGAGWLRRLAGRLRVCRPPSSSRPVAVACAEGRAAPCPKEDQLTVNADAETRRDESTHMDKQIAGVHDGRTCTEQSPIASSSASVMANEISVENLGFHVCQIRVGDGLISSFSSSSPCGSQFPLRRWRWPRRTGRVPQSGRAGRPAAA